MNRPESNSEYDSGDYLRICRCCLSFENVSLSAANDYIHLIQLLGGTKMERCELICCFCRCTLRKILHFRNMCLQADSALMNTHQNTLYQVFNEKFKVTAVERPSLSNTLCIDVATHSDTDSSSEEIISFARDSNPAKNYTQGMTPAGRNVKSESEADRQFDTGLDLQNDSDYDPFEPAAIKEEVHDVGDGFDDLTAIFKPKLKKNRKDGRKKKKHKSKEKSIQKEEFVKYEDFSCEVHLSLSEQLKEREDRLSSAEYLAAAYRCEECVLSFKTVGSLERHAKKHSPSRGAYTCGLCSQRFPSERRLVGHSGTHAVRLVCTTCGAHLRDRPSLREHLNWHAGIKFPCHVCSRHFSRRSTLRNHLRLDHGGQKYECDICGKIFKSKERLTLHFRCHTGVRSHACDTCGKAFYSASNLALHAATHLPPALSHYCVECDKHFRSAYILKMHLLKSSRHRDHATLRFPCTLCPRRYDSAEALSRHVRAQHERVTPLACDACGARYATRHGLNFHRRKAHQGFTLPLKYTCHTCNKAFTAKAILTNHMRTHTGERPFECVDCHRKFSQKSALQTHVKLVHLKLKRNIKSRKRLVVDSPKARAKTPLVDPSLSEQSKGAFRVDSDQNATAALVSVAWTDHDAETKKDLENDSNLNCKDETKMNEIHNVFYL